METEINSKLYHKAQSLMASNAYLKKGMSISDKVLNLLKQKSGFNISRQVHSAAAYKKTLLPQSDYEMAILVNDEEPPFQILLLGFEKTFKEHGLIYDVDVDDIRRTMYSLKVTVGDFEFDLYPGSNFVQNKGFLSGEEQQKKTLEKIKKDIDRNAHLYNSSVAEARVLFFEAQSSFVNEMVRLAKFWYKKAVDITVVIPGAKSLIELVMIHLAKQETKKNYIQCFKKFLSQLQDFEHIVVVFEDVKAAGFKIPPNIREQVPLVLDPANPFNNLAKYWDTMNKTILLQSARNTEQRIAKLKESDSIDILFQ